MRIRLCPVLLSRMGHAEAAFAARLEAASAARVACRASAAIAVLALLAGPGAAEQLYKQPPREVVDILNAPPTPLALVSPTRETLLLAEYEAHPPIALLARPFLKLGGIRVDPARSSTQRIRQYTGFTLVDVPSGGVMPVHRPVALPEGARVQLPVWSFDGRRFAFARDRDDGVELWIADAGKGEAHPVSGVQLNDVLGAPIAWLGDNRRLLVRTVPVGRGIAPETSPVPTGPDVQETAGKKSRMATFQDLLDDAQDEALFDYYGLTQLVLVDVESGSVTTLGTPGLYLDAKFSEDLAFVLVTRLQRPFSFRVPYYYFTRSIEVWNADGRIAGTVASIPVSDEIPPQGVPKGPRSVEWEPLLPAMLAWVEALDGGDPKAKADRRDRMMRVDVRAALGAPRAGGAAGKPALSIPDLSAGAAEVLQLEERFSGVRWTTRPHEALVSEYDRERRWNTTWLVTLADAGTSAGSAARRKMFDLSANDDYNDPGQAVLDRRRDGAMVLLQDGDWAYFAGRGATPEGDRPFLDRLNLKTLQKERLFRSDAQSLESFVSFPPGKERRRIVTNYQSRTAPPNWHAVDLKSKQRTPLTAYADPAPQLTGIQKQLLKYHRADGVPLSGFLYLPPGYQPGTRLPLVVWAYPLEYSDASTAGQVRGSPNSFVRLMGDSPLFFLTQGYAVLQDAAMPVIGDPETMNDTYVEQIVGAAKAALDTLDAIGVIDRDRVCVAGHSYGAFMTVNLLAHSDLFAAGIARSGAYNRTLTPFGFQAERRSYWEATDVYTRISPFTHADKINEPVLLVHGEADNNSGTFPIQSERLFQAIQGNGGTARLVLLPHEGHGYRARESVMHVLAEMFEWCDRYVKNRPPQGRDVGSR